MLGVRESLYRLYTSDTRRYLRYLMDLGEHRSRLVILGSRCSPCGEVLAMDQRAHHQRVARGCMVSGRAHVDSTPATPGPVIQGVRHEKGSWP